MRVTRREITDLAAAVAWVGELGARTVVLDVEPLVASWDTDESTLRAGVVAVVGRLSAVPGLEVVWFVTNSRRRAPAGFAETSTHGFDVFYVRLARKPVVARRYRPLPRPGVLIGDQVATDGVLAWRLGFAFGQVTPGPAAGVRPWGPAAMGVVGRPLLPLLFRREP